MPNKVLLKKSSVAAKVPLTSDIDYGELALNYTDGKLYFKNASNVIKNFVTDGGSTTHSDITITGGTSNGVAYLNGSKVLTTGTALTFDGTNLGIGTSVPLANLQVGSSSALTNYQSGLVGLMLPTGSGTWLEFAENTTNGTSFRISKDASSGVVLNTNVKDLAFRAGSYDTTVASSQMVLKTSGNVGIGTNAPNTKLDVAGAKNTSAINITQTAPTVANAFDDYVGIDFRMYNEVFPVTQFTGNPSARISSYLESGSNIFGLDFWTRSGAGAFGKVMRLTGAGGLSFGATGTAYGTAGQVLQSNGNASPTWVNHVTSIAATTPILTSAATGAITLSHATSGVTAATYNNVTVNATGHVTAGSNVAYLTALTDTLATVTGRGATTSTASSFTGGLSATGITLNGTLSINNATSPNTNTIQFGDNTGWNFRFMTSVSGTPTTRFTFNDGGNFTAVGTIAASNFSGTHSGSSSGTNTGDNPGVTSVAGVTPIISSGGNTPSISHATSGVGAGTYNNVTVNTFGHVTAGSNVGYISSYTETDTLATVTARGATTGTSVTLSGGGNEFNGHFYFTPYDAAGNHYPHFRDGANGSGSKINWRLFTGATNSVVHTWTTSLATFATNIAASNFSGSSSGTNTGDNPGVTSVAGVTPIVSSGGNTPSISHATSGVTAGTYNNVTVNTFGHVTAGSNVGYISSYTETDTLATVTGRGATTSTASTFSGGLTGRSAAAVAAITSVTAPNASFFAANSATGAGGFAPAFGQTTTVSGGYVSHMVLGSYRSGGNNWNGGPMLAWGGADANATENWLFNNGGAITHSSGRNQIDTANYNSYSPTLTGGGAGGTWGINISGNSANTSQTAFSDLSIVGAAHKYLYINPGNGYEAMVGYNGGSGSGWYVGKRMTSQTVGTESFHFYSEAATKTVAGIDTSGNMVLTGSLSAISKSFVIDHPTKPGMKLRYGSLESPYHGVRLTGEATAINGECTVQLPDYIHGLVHSKDAQVQLTNYKHGKVLWVDDISIDANCFTVKMDININDTTEYKFFWSFTAVRKDIEDMEVEF